MIWPIVFSKVLLATFVVLVAVVIERLSRKLTQPEVVYSAWFAVILILLLPPVLSVPVWESPSVDQTTGPKGSKLDSLGMLSKGPVAHSPQTQKENLNTRSALSDSSFPEPPDKQQRISQQKIASTIIASTDQSSGTITSNNVGGQEISWLRPLGYVLLVVWITGTLYLLIQHFLQIRVLKRLVNAAEQTPKKYHCQLLRAARKLKIKGRLPSLVQANGAFSPFLWHPMLGEASIVVPQRLLVQINEDSLDAVLRHELVHFRRKDSFRRTLELIATAIWWWLPFSWYSQTKLRQLEELCVDRESILAMPESRMAYARALLDTDEFLAAAIPDKITSKIFVVPSFTGQNQLKKRIEMIVKKENGYTKSWLSRWASIAICLTFIPSGLLMAGSYPALQTQASESDNQEQKQQQEQGLQQEQNQQKQRQNSTTENLTEAELEKLIAEKKAELEELITSRNQRRSGSQKNDNRSKRYRAQRIDKSKSNRGNTSPKGNRNSEGFERYNMDPLSMLNLKENHDGTTVTLLRRTRPEYGQSAYSFRFKTQDLMKHRNYVDVVYSADGKLRINNYGGLTSEIYDLGKTASLKISKSDLRKSKAKSDRGLKPEVGSTYVLKLNEDGESLTVVFAVSKLYEDRLDLVWQPKSTKKWRGTVSNRGAAGVSGMNANPNRSRYYRSGSGR